MTSNTIWKKCSGCNKTRKFVPSEHGYASGYEWHLDGPNKQLICCWCHARKTPDGEKLLRERQAAIRKDRKEANKAWNRRQDKRLSF